MIENTIQKDTRVFNKSIGEGKFIQWIPTSSLDVHIALIETNEGKFQIPRTELNII
ncbi:hypothetical protein KKH23_05535 [Patescibacteria group bacterium]|nr:hypothetical protein [Patescibacteria group bacterium]